MSAAYTLHLRRDTAPGDAVALERAALVRDGFAWGAFLLPPPLWFWRHGHALLGLLAILAEILLAYGLRKLGVGTGAVVLVLVLVQFLFGLEGASLRRLAYALRKRPVADVVVAGNLAEAELKSFARFLEAAPALPASPIYASPFTSPFVRREPDPVLGLFPHPERRP